MKEKEFSFLLDIIQDRLKSILTNLCNENYIMSAYTIGKLSEYIADEQDNLQKFIDEENARQALEDGIM